MVFFTSCMATCRTPRLQQQPGYIHIYVHQTKWGKKKKVPVIYNQSAGADDVHHDHIIPKPWLMKRISHMVLAHNASHLLQGLSGLSRPSRQNSLLVSLCTSNVACFRLFSRHFLIFISRWAPHACAMPSSSFMETL